MRSRFILLSLLYIGIGSCKTSFSIHEYPRKPEGIIITGKCLVNEIRTTIPMKNQQKIVEKMMSDLQRFIPEVYFAGYDHEIINLGLPLNPLAHPEIIEKLYREFGYDYVIDFQATSTDTQTVSGVAFGKQYFDHQVGVTISVFNTKTQKVLYTQRIELHEKGDESDDDDFQESDGGFVITRSSENLLKIGIKKCTKQLRKSIDRKIASE